MAAAFEQAWRRHRADSSASYCSFVGQVARFRFVGCRLAEQIGRPFSHLRIPPVDSGVLGLRIDLFDGGATEMSCPVDRGAHARQAGSPEDRFVLWPGHHLTAWFDRDARHLVGWAPGGARLSVHELARPVHIPLLLWHCDRRVQGLHAGLVAKSGIGVLLAGDRGTGKSITALACLAAGFSFLGDDRVGLQELRDGSFLGHSLYNTAMLRIDDVARFPHLTPHAIQGKGPSSGVAVLLLSEVIPQQLARTAAIRLIVLPRVTERSVAQIRPARRGQALLALAPSTIVRLPGSGQQTLDRLAQLVERVPCYWLDVGRDLESIPRCVEELLPGAGLL